MELDKIHRSTRRDRLTAPGHGMLDRLNIICPATQATPLLEGVTGLDQLPDHFKNKLD